MGLLDDLDLSAITDEHARQCIVLLLNQVEELKQETVALRAENQRLRDEINRLKGEQGKPTILGNTPTPAPRDYSSEGQRHTPKEWTKSAKTATIRIDREQTLVVDPTVLPPDAEFKGYEDVVVQDIVLGTANMLFHKEKFYSPTEHQSYLAPLPPGYAGQFGPGIKALAITLYHGANVSEPKIRELLGSVGVLISAGQVSNLLIHDQDGFHAEKAAVYAAGLASSPWQHLDDTPTRVDGENQYCQIVCNPLYTSYHTIAAKDRASVLAVLRDGRPPQYRLNAEAVRLLAGVLSATARRQVSALPWDEPLDEATMTHLLKERLPELGPQQRKWVRDAMAVAAYHAEVGVPVIQLLICDDAPQFTWLTEELALCWVHEARHFNKLLPYFAPHRTLLAAFMTRFWDYYDDLLAYRENPTAAERDRLGTSFDTLFATQTGYAGLDERIAKTRAKKTALLMVLSHPEIPLHNNPAELGARRRVRKRDVSFGPRAAAGAKAWDTFQTLAATATKVGVSFYAYIHDRISQANQMPALATLITARAKDLTLATSWTTP